MKLSRVIIFQVALAAGTVSILSGLILWNGATPPFLVAGAVLLSVAGTIYNRVPRALTFEEIAILEMNGEIPVAVRFTVNGHRVEQRGNLYRVDFSTPYTGDDGPYAA